MALTDLIEWDSLSGHLIRFRWRFGNPQRVLVLRDSCFLVRCVYLVYYTTF